MRFDGRKNLFCHKIMLNIYIYVILCVYIYIYIYSYIYMYILTFYMLNLLARFLF